MGQLIEQHSPAAAAFPVVKEPVEEWSDARAKGHSVWSGHQAQFLWGTEVNRIRPWDCLGLTAATILWVRLEQNSKNEEFSGFCQWSENGLLVRLQAFSAWCSIFNCVYMFFGAFKGGRGGHLAKMLQIKTGFEAVHLFESIAQSVGTCSLGYVLAVMWERREWGQNSRELIYSDIGAWDFRKEPRS